MARKSRWLPNTEESSKLHSTISDAWVYSRISNETDKSEDSIDNQIAIAKEYIGSQPDLVFKDVFTDLGFSGTNFDRPGYRDMMAGILSGKVRCVVVKDLSRLGRTYIEVGELLFDTFIQYNVRFISVNDRYDSAAEDAGRKKLLILFKNLVNHMYSKDLGKKIKSSFMLKQQKGELLGCLPPYGYTFTTEGGGKRLQVEPVSAEIVKLIFDMRLQGCSSIKITDYLNQNGILAPRNHYYGLGLLTKDKDAVKTVWQNSYICNLLINEVYTGDQIQGKYERHGKRFDVRPKEEWIIHKDAHPAIVDKEQFDVVQELIAASKEKYKKRGNKLDENIYVGKVFCTRCGKAAKRGYYRKNKSEVKYTYRCRYCYDELKYTHGMDAVKPVTLEKLEAVVNTAIQNQMDACLDIDGLLDKIANSMPISQKKQMLAKERHKLQKEVRKAGDMLSAAYTHHLEGLLDSNEFELARSKFERDKQNAKAGLARLDNELSEYELDAVRQNECLVNFRSFKGFESLDKEIVGVLVNRIEINPTTKVVDVVLNFNDSFSRLVRLAKESEVLAYVR